MMPLPQRHHYRRLEAIFWSDSDAVLGFRHVLHNEGESEEAGYLIHPYYTNAGLSVDLQNASGLDTSPEFYVLVGPLPRMLPFSSMLETDTTALVAPSWHPVPIKPDPWSHSPNSLCPHPGTRRGHRPQRQPQ